MVSQLFKKSIPVNFLQNFLKENCTIDKKFYIISKTLYRQLEYHQKLDKFYEELLEYYHESKKYYINRKKDYNRFTTVIRQLCRFNNISYTSRIVYNKSNYEIIYYISTETL